MAEEQIQHRKSGSVVSAHYFVLIWRSIVFEKSAYEKKKKKYLRHKASNNSLKRLVRMSKSGYLSTCPFLPAISFILFLYSFFSQCLPSIPTTTMLTSSFWMEVRTNEKQINIKTILVEERKRVNERRMTSAPFPSRQRKLLFLRHATQVRTRIFRNLISLSFPLDYHTNPPKVPNI